MLPRHRARSPFHIEGLSHSEIASTLGAPIGTVKSRMRLAYEKIRDAVEEEK